MKTKILVAPILALSLSACYVDKGPANGSSMCSSGANALRPAVGLPTGQAFKYIEIQPKPIKDLVVVAGSATKASTIQRGKIVVALSTPNPADALTTNSGVTRIYCNE